MNSPPKWWTPELKARAEALLEERPGISPKKLARALGIPLWKGKRIVEGYRAGLGRPTKHPYEVAKVKEKGGGEAPPSPFRVEVAGERAVAEGLAPHQDLEAFLRENGVDLQAWEVERYIVNRWETAAKIGDELQAKPLHQIKVWLRRKVGEDGAFLQELFAALAERAPALPPPPPRPPRGGEPRMAVLAVPDLHVGKLAWGEETGENYDTKIALEVWQGAVRALLARAAAYPHEVERLIIPLGNDLFHIDTLENTTTKGTRVDVDSRWQKAFRLVTEFVIEEVVERARSLSPQVKVVMIPGNHDHQRTFYLGEVLRAFYRKSSDVEVDNAPKPRKYELWKRVLLGWAHGHREKAKDLPLLMAVESPHEWGLSAWREWQIGHYHARKQYHYMPLVDERGVVVRVLPSLSGVDAWHAEQGFVGANKTATLIIYHPEGEEATFHYTPPKEVYVRH
jgi:hypothetical protein